MLKMTGTALLGTALLGPTAFAAEAKPEEKKDKDDATVFTYAIALKKIDPEGNELVGAKFKLRGVTVTEKSKGYYKVKTYSHSIIAGIGMRF